MAIGGTLVGLALAGFDAAVAAVVAGKLLLHPLAVALALAAIGALYPILASRYGQGRVATTAMMTVLSFAAVNALLRLFVLGEA